LLLQGRTYGVEGLQAFPIVVCPTAERAQTSSANKASGDSCIAFVVFKIGRVVGTDRVINAAEKKKQGKKNERGKKSDATVVFCELRSMNTGDTWLSCQGQMALRL
jgi:hypothetical protein